MFDLNVLFSLQNFQAACINQDGSVSVESTNHRDIQANRYLIR